MSHVARYFSRKSGLADFVSTGALAPLLDDLAAELEAQGYTASTILGYVRCARHVTYCIERRQLARRELTLAGLLRFARTHGASCRCPHPAHAASANFRSCMAHLLPLLERAGLAPAAARQVPFADELRAYENFMAEVRGLSDVTRALSLRNVAIVLRALMPRGRFDASRLKASALQAHVSALAERCAPNTVRRRVGAIRDFLRFLQTRGTNTSRALTLLKGPRSTRSLSSKKALTVPQTRALLAPLQVREPHAMRDLAIIFLLGLVGLRREDVVKLRLEDFNPRARALTVRRSKSRRAFELPVPDEALDAVLRYVRYGRPAVATSALFVTQGFPYDVGITASAVSAVVARAFKKARIQHPSKGTHVLRHTLATQLVAARQPLKAIADVMRHREIDTTAQYVRVDLERMRAAARAWPEEASDGSVRAT